jgi:ATP-dependent DNA ligase
MCPVPASTRIVVPVGTLITEPMLAGAVATLPDPAAFPGGSVYEPKWDGYRGLVHHSDAACRVMSRNGNDLTDCFPDIAAAICSQLPPGTILDGELVVWRGDRIDFTALGERLTARRRCPDLAREHPATFMAFDLLQHEGVDLTRQPLRTRRTALEWLAGDWCPPLQLTPQTTDVEVAERWLEEYASVDVGVEGLVVKGLAQSYRPGVRGWRKYRIRHTREAVVGAVTGPPEAPRSLVLALPAATGTRMRAAGVTLPLTASQAQEMAVMLSPYTGDDPWWGSPQLTIGGFGADPIPAHPVDPTIVVEVSADTAFERGRWRHPTRYLRHRPDLGTADIVNRGWTRDPRGYVRSTVAGSR